VRSLRSFIKKVPLEKKAIDINDQVAETLKSWRRRQDRARSSCEAK
jgi:hypothetical protein